MSDHFNFEQDSSEDMFPKIKENDEVPYSLGLLTKEIIKKKESTEKEFRQNESNTKQKMPVIGRANHNLSPQSSNSPKKSSLNNRASLNSRSNIIEEISSKYSYSDNFSQKESQTPQSQCKKTQSRQSSKPGSKPSRYNSTNKKVSKNLSQETQNYNTKTKYSKKVDSKQMKQSSSVVTLPKRKLECADFVEIRFLGLDHCALQQSTQLREIQSKIKQLRRKINDIKNTLKISYDIDQVVVLENELAQKNKAILSLTDSKVGLNAVKRSQKQFYTEINPKGRVSKKKVSVSKQLEIQKFNYAKMQKEVQTMEKDLDERHLEFIDKETECRRMTNKIKALQKSKKTSQPLLQMSQSQTFNSGPNRFLAETSKADLNELSTKLNHQKKELSKAKNSFAAKNDRVKAEINKIKENNSKQDQQIHLTNMRIKELERYIKNCSSARFNDAKSTTEVSIKAHSTWTSSAEKIKKVKKKINTRREIEYAHLPIPKNTFLTQRYDSNDRKQSPISTFQKSMITNSSQEKTKDQTSVSSTPAKRLNNRASDPMILNTVKEEDLEETVNNINEFQKTVKNLKLPSKQTSQSESKSKTGQESSSSSGSSNSRDSSGSSSSDSSSIEDEYSQSNFEAIEA
ncbi:unnamed protein product [Moneuplotes crassus]|uniref:Lebercilin domain-containing protein n=1 Tax=Euplotes crassus TaxID=5936 RepID=A0AAD2DAS9_EUPCR|nr:unnamed protein product [Moneuplotes crassus]